MTSSRLQSVAIATCKTIVLCKFASKMLSQIKLVLELLPAFVAILVEHKVEANTLLCAGDQRTACATCRESILQQMAAQKKLV